MLSKEEQAVRFTRLAEDVGTVRRFLGSRPAIAEAYSPPRITAEGRKMGLKCGFSFDAKVLDKDGYVWDFTKRSCRRKAWKRLKDECPHMLVGSPPCTAFSIIQNLNARTPEGRWKVENAKRPATIHLEFCAAMYLEQIRAGRYFVHEHPDTATSWQVPCIENLTRLPEVKVARADLCMFGLKSSDSHGEAPARKPKKFMTNGLEVFKVLKGKCDGTSPRHVHLMEGRLKQHQSTPGNYVGRCCRARSGR